MVNAILRKAPASLEEVSLPDPEKSLVEFLRVRFSLPRWMVRDLIERFGPEKAADICALTGREAPVCLRVNTRKDSVEAVAARLAKAGFATVKATPLPEELTVVEGRGLTSSRLFQEGLVLVQDPASQMPAILLDAAPGDRVLDLCAAPGGKATHIAQRVPEGLFLVAADNQPRRIGQIQENFERLGLEAAGIVCADGMRPPFRGGSFDRVLLDAPCSGLGTLRRHPDIKWHATPESVLRLAETQRALLRGALRLCKNGGVVVYSVCTFTRQETTEVVESLLSEGACAPEDGPETLSPWKTARGQYQTDPSDPALDAFFLTRLRKLS
jgi:16S rRNA (cytosine967-C5)-methyltransferase